MLKIHKTWNEKEVFFFKKNPYPPRIFLFYTNFFLMLEIAWNAKKTYIEKKN